MNKLNIKAGFERKGYDKIMQKLGMVSKSTTIINVINQAAKRAAAAGATETKRRIKRSYTLRPEKVNKAVSTYATGSPLDMAIGVKISDSSHPLSRFKFTPKKPPKKRGIVVSSEVKRGQKDVYTKGAFVQTMPKNNHTGIFQREDEKRKSMDSHGRTIEDSKEKVHINPLFGPPVTKMVESNDNINKAIWDKMFETMEVRVNHELGRLLNV